jgi:hypothetical protein
VNGTKDNAQPEARNAWPAEGPLLLLANSSKRLAGQLRNLRIGSTDCFAKLIDSRRHIGLIS